MSGTTIMNTIVKTKEEFIAECEQEIKSRGKVLLAWRIVLEDEGVRDGNMYCHKPIQVQGLLMMGGLENIQISRPQQSSDTILFI